MHQAGRHWILEYRHIFISVLCHGLARTTEKFRFFFFFCSFSFHSQHIRCNDTEHCWNIVYMCASTGGRRIEIEDCRHRRHSVFSLSFTLFGIFLFYRYIEMPIGHTHIQYADRTDSRSSSWDTFESMQPNSMHSHVLCSVYFIFIHFYFIFWFHFVLNLLPRKDNLKKSVNRKFRLRWLNCFCMYRYNGMAPKRPFFGCCCCCCCWMLLDVARNDAFFDYYWYEDMVDNAP